MPGRQISLEKWAWLAALWACLLPGCASLRVRSWQPPQVVVPVTSFKLLDDAGDVSVAETWYAEAVRLDGAGSATAVDAYLQCAVAAWPAVEMLAGDVPVVQPAEGSPVHDGVEDSREWKLYHSAVVGLITSAQKWGRWSPQTGLLAMGPQGLAPLETAYHGFAWTPTEFGTLHCVGDYQAPQPERIHRRDGVGVPLVVVRSDVGPQRPFIRPERRFAATALVRPVWTAAGATVRLEFYNPLRESQLQTASGAVPLAGDATAPIVYAGVNLPQAWLEPFIRPAGGGTDDRLYMFEPYQPGKIPVVFIHGLLSDPLTWADMLNELQVQPQLTSRYQFWAFRYDTGEPFLTSAAALRRQLAELKAYYNPGGDQAAMSNMVLVGHSMGGLVANLQVTYSGEALWNATSRIPLEQVRTDAATRAAFGAAFFFDPNDDVSRVVYIGTPHLGSAWARRAVGSLGSALIETPPQVTERHEQLVRDNPGDFSEELTRRFPTSIDLLEPSSPLLNAAAKLPYRRGVTLHTVVGEGRYTVGSGPSDGVVPVNSARLAGSSSEKFVESSHSSLPRNEQVIVEVMRILEEHARVVDASSASAMLCK